MVIIVPTVFAKNEKEFKQRFKLVASLANQIQIDFMDGKFHKVKGVMPSVVPNLKRRKQKFEAHLMIAHPERWVDKVADKGFDRFLFHIESQRNRKATARLIERVTTAGMKPGIVVNPKTSLSRVEPFLESVPVVMFMGHRPGVENVGIEKGVLQKIRHVRRRHPKLIIEVDGGVDDKTAPRFVKAGATRLSVGSYISKSANPKRTLSTLRRIIRS